MHAKILIYTPDPYIHAIFLIYTPDSLCTRQILYIHARFLIYTPDSLYTRHIPYIHATFLICTPHSLHTCHIPHIHARILICTPYSLYTRHIPYIHATFLQLLAASVSRIAHPRRMQYTCTCITCLRIINHQFMYKTIIISIYWHSFIVCVSMGTVCDKYWHLFDSLINLKIK